MRGLGERRTGGRCAVRETRGARVGEESRAGRETRREGATRGGRRAGTETRGGGKAWGERRAGRETRGERAAGLYIRFGSRGGAVAWRHGWQCSARAKHRHRSGWAYSGRDGAGERAAAGRAAACHTLLLRLCLPCRGAQARAGASEAGGRMQGWREGCGLAYSCVPHPAVPAAFVPARLWSRRAAGAQGATPAAGGGGLPMGRLPEAERAGGLRPGERLHATGSERDQGGARGAERSVARLLSISRSEGQGEVQTPTQNSACGALLSIEHYSGIITLHCFPDTLRFAEKMERGKRDSKAPQERQYSSHGKRFLVRQAGSGEL
jgi:hypothetical protein